MVLQLCEPVQLMSHAHELLHDTPSHELMPEHVTSHGPGPHSTPWHVLPDEHITAHDAPPVQSTPLRHMPSRLQRMSQW